MTVESQTCDYCFSFVTKHSGIEEETLYALQVIEEVYRRLSAEYFPVQKAKSTDAQKVAST